MSTGVSPADRARAMFLAPLNVLIMTVTLAMFALLALLVMLFGALGAVRGKSHRAHGGAPVNGV